MDINPQSETTVRLSLSLIIVAIIIIIGAGMAGGVLIQQLVPASQPLAPSTDKVVTTVQEVTVSPNTIASDIISRTQRSIVLLGPTSTKNIETTGVVVTNDGVIVTPHTISTSQPYMYDDRGVAIPIHLIGQDALFGLTYYRIESGVFPALDFRRDDPAVGYDLLSVSRSLTTFQSRSLNWQVQEYILPSTDIPVGVQRLLQLKSVVNDSTLTGSPLLDDEGKIAAVVVNPATGMALSSRIIQESLNRIVQDKRETNPIKDVGLSVRYIFTNPTATDPVIFGSQIIALTPGSVAQAAGLHTGDIITEVNGQPLQWDTSLVSTISKALPLPITVLRDGQKQTLTLSALSR